MSDDTPVDDLELGVRARDLLRKAGMETVGQLRTTPDATLLREPNFGRKYLDEIRALVPFGPASDTRAPNDLIQLKLRFVNSLRGRIEESARRNGNSMNGEIVARLNASFDHDFNRDAAATLRAIKAILA